MGQLIVNKRIPYKLIPEILQSDFERILIETYCEGRWHDLHSLTFHVDMFAVYSVSYEETGDPFDFTDDQGREESNAIIIKSDFNRLMEDVHAVMNYHHIFHSWDDAGKNGEYRYISPMNLPIVETW